MGSYTVYARSPSPSQRPAPTTIASQSPAIQQIQRDNLPKNIRQIVPNPYHSRQVEIFKAAMI